MGSVLRARKLFATLVAVPALAAAFHGAWPVAWALAGVALLANASVGAIVMAFLMGPAAWAMTTSGTFADGTAYQLRRPRYAGTGTIPSAYSVRVTPALVGMGLLEAIPESASTIHRALAGRESHRRRLPNTGCGLVRGFAVGREECRGILAVMPQAQLAQRFQLVLTRESRRRQFLDRRFRGMWRRWGRRRRKRALGRLRGLAAARRRLPWNRLRRQHRHNLADEGAAWTCRRRGQCRCRQGVLVAHLRPQPDDALLEQPVVDGVVEPESSTLRPCYRPGIHPQQIVHVHLLGSDSRLWTTS